MRQRLLPGFPERALRIGEMVSMLVKDGQDTYFIGGDSYFSQPVGDLKSQRFALTSLMANRHLRSVDLPATVHSAQYADALEDAQLATVRPRFTGKRRPTSRAS